MSVSGAYMWNVGKNFAVTAGFVYGGALTTWATNKLGHYIFGVKKEDFKKTPTFAIRQAAFFAGVAATYCLASRASLTTFPLDTQFYHAHIVPALLGLCWTFSAYLTASWDGRRATAIFFGIAGVLLGTPAAGYFGNTVLPVAGGFGAMIGTFV
jgi:hypothetical protein